MSSRSLRQIAPGRLEVREGGGCMAVFGFPFFAAGLFMLLAGGGVVPLSSTGPTQGFTMPVLLFMGCVFTLVGAALVFGRSWTTLSSGDRTILKQRGLLVPMTATTYRVDDYDRVLLAFIRGDSDRADRYPIRLRARAGHDLELFTSSQYAESREWAAAVAELFHFEIEDSSTGGPLCMSAAQANLSFEYRQRLEHRRDEAIAPPAAMRSDVKDSAGGLTIVIPASRVHPAALLFFLVPMAVSLLLFEPFSLFFRQSRTPDVLSWVFLGFLCLVFGVLPATAALRAALRSRRGRTTITVSAAGVRIEERGIWKTRTLAALQADDIVDVDYKTAESVLASSEGAATAIRRRRPSTAPLPAGQRTERMVKKLHRLSGGGAVIIKARHGLTTFGQGLDDLEIRYLHYAVRRALAG
jgi:hypothetical protein